tara:strand:+ start:509 stop:2665 length:2157 start_codon:yes stop_codon:yes gene_type:complete
MLAKGLFEHGVASGDPYSDSVILWTRVTPVTPGEIQVKWEIAADNSFSEILGNGQTATNEGRDYTVKVEADSLVPGTNYYYRFSLEDGKILSPIGRTKTLPSGAIEKVRFALFSCANLTANYFNPYGKAAEVGEVEAYDAIIHVGDYIYEYGRGGYTAAEDMINRVGFEPDRECVSLNDYRLRYAQYHREPSLKRLRASAPLIAIWDDHETANDSWATGAQNHSTDGSEGNWSERVTQALQAYYEWLPIREPENGNRRNAYRSFQFGDLVSLYMLETRLSAREEQLSLAPSEAQVNARILEILANREITQQYAELYSIPLPSNTPDSAEIRNFSNALALVIPNEMIINTLQEAYSGDRNLLGEEQLSWLINGLTNSSSKWQVLGQQVLMGNMTLPGELLLELASGNASQTTIGKYYTPALKVANGLSLTPEEQSIFDGANPLPYNLDAWDGYGKERETILQAAISLEKQMVVLAGDTHNAWTNLLKTMNPQNLGIPAAIEFATSGVSAPGIEKYFPGQEEILRVLFESYSPRLRYADLMHKGFVDLTFTQAEVKTRYFLKTARNTSNDWQIRTVTSQDGKDVSVSELVQADDVDNDNDGLPTWRENVLGTSNSLPDSDLDGMTDLLEVNYNYLGFDPTENDLDTIFSTLYTEDSIQDLNLGGLMIRKDAENKVSIEFKIETSQNLGAAWETLETIDKNIETDAPKEFLRIRSGVKVNP